MAKTIFHLFLGFSLVVLVRSQTTSPDSESTCGYIDGDAAFAVDCSFNACGFLSIFGRGIAYAGCCGDANCAIPTTCIESGTASDSHTVECTDGSLSACATYTWPELSAEGYFCAPSQTTATVITETNVSTFIEESSALPTETASEPQPTTADEEPTEPLPTIDESRPPEEPRPTETQDTGPPDLGTEHDLSSKQRVGAGVGSGVSGGLLLIFFAIFGCCRRPRRRTGNANPQQVSQVVERKDAQAPVQAGSPR